MKDIPIIKLLMMGTEYKPHDKFGYEIVKLLSDLDESKYYHAISLPSFVTLEREYLGNRARLMICDPGIKKGQTYPGVYGLLLYLETDKEIQVKEMMETVEEAWGFYFSRLVP